MTVFYKIVGVVWSWRASPTWVSGSQPVNSFRRLHLFQNRKMRIDCPPPSFVFTFVVVRVKSPSVEHRSNDNDDEDPVDSNDCGWITD
ncbi:hypothetical protein KIN20_029487 [Parelaphostrongylus tenuis]|uniref:Uncharacterized protein n=1 Tax=Parelaphostrongylus tenuis TaxID=148309 RepID=A0AAD5R2Q2_PARTN|nr:hypothetical protein KIN20_029487 [Parelaphostrongylus tenuis]